MEIDRDLASNSKTIFVKFDSMISSDVLENRQLVASSITIENGAKNVVTEHKSGICMMKCRFSVSSNMGTEQRESLLQYR